MFKTQNHLFSPQILHQSKVKSPLSPINYHFSEFSADVINRQICEPQRPFSRPIDELQISSSVTRKALISRICASSFAILPSVLPLFISFSPPPPDQPHSQFSSQCTFPPYPPQSPRGDVGARRSVDAATQGAQGAPGAQGRRGAWGRRAQGAGGAGRAFLLF